MATVKASSSIAEYAVGGVIARKRFRNQRFHSTAEISGLLLRECELSRVAFPHFTFIDCRFERCHFSNAIFRDKRSEEGTTRTIGSLFLRCTFDNCLLDRCNFVMSTLRETRFEGCKIHQCDFRNVTWMDRFVSRTGKWVDSKSGSDPFTGSQLTKTRFGHPLSNMMSVPKEMMIPPSYQSVWDHIPEPQKSFLRLSYMMGEPPQERFSSAV